MEMRGEQLVLASRELVWRAVNDPQILRECIPGCQELSKTSDTEMSATVVVKVGPVSAKMKGKVKLSDLQPPASLRLSGEGEGGVAGFAKGHATVSLEDRPEGTLLSYSVEADVGGKLAQIGSRLIDATSKKLTAEFFRKFSDAVLRLAQPPEPPPATIANVSDATSSPRPQSPVAAAQTSIPSAARGPVPMPPAEQPSRYDIIVLLGLVAAVALAWWLSGSRPADESGDVPNFVAALLIIMAAAIGFLFGRQRR